MTHIGNTSDTDAAQPRHARIAALDVLRGFALCGILVANVQPIGNVGNAVTTQVPSSLDDPMAWVGLAVSQRFFPIFSLLFGIGFALLAESAGQRSARPWVVLARRLLVLLAIGLVHMFVLWRGDILTIYAAVGLVILLPSTWLPRWAVAGLSAVVIAAVLVLGQGWTLLVPGLFLLGSALVRYGVIDRLERSTAVPLLLGLAFAAGAVPATWWHILAIESGSDAAFGQSMTVSGLLTAGVYVCTVVVLLRTPLRSVLRALFAPLGKMALTHYLAATVVVLLAVRVFGLRPDSAASVLLTAGAVVAAQWLFSVLWLRRYRQGPLEWLWRWATWAQRPPQRAERTPA